jgi:Uncharacterized bacitracin resistance protein
VTAGFASVPQGLTTADRVDVFATFGGARPFTVLVGEDLRVLRIDLTKDPLGDAGTMVTLDVEPRPRVSCSRRTRPARSRSSLAARTPALHHLHHPRPEPNPPRDRLAAPPDRKDARDHPAGDHLGDHPGHHGVRSGLQQRTPDPGPWLFGWSIVQDPALNKTFDVALHVGTLVGAVIYFRIDLWRYFKAWIASIRARSIRSADERLAWALVVGDDSPGR